MRRLLGRIRNPLLALTPLALAILLGDSGESAVAATAPSSITFSDVTAEAGLPTTDLSTHGVQWGDYDQDGRLDLHMSTCHYGPWPRAALYHNNGDGTFTDEIIGSGLDRKFDRHGCAWGDYNADHWPDFFCAQGGQGSTSTISFDFLWSNNQEGTFTRIPYDVSGIDDPLGRGRVASWFDYDSDGYLDLFVGNGKRIDATNRLYHNNGDGSFTDVSLASGLGITISTKSASVADYDHDGYADLVLGTYQGLRLFRNRQDGTFENATAATGLPGRGRFEGVTWGDYNNDGYLDLFVAQVGKTALLYKNTGSGSFVKVKPGTSGIQEINSNVGLWGDYNNDTWPDLFIVNRDDPITGANAPDTLYLNNGDGTFSNVAAAAGVTGPTKGWGDTAAWADFNNDGFLDIMVTNGDQNHPDDLYGPPVLYKNNGNGNHWLKIQPRMLSGGNYFGLGTKMWITVGGVTQYRELTDMTSLHQQNEQVVHFGLGAAQTVDEITVRWPDGQSETLSAIPADQTLVITH